MNFVGLLFALCIRLNNCRHRLHELNIQHFQYWCPIIMRHTIRRSNCLHWRKSGWNFVFRVSLLWAHQFLFIYYIRQPAQTFGVLLFTRSHFAVVYPDKRKKRSLSRPENTMKTTRNWGQTSCTLFRDKYSQNNPIGWYLILHIRQMHIYARVCTTHALSAKCEEHMTKTML